MTGADLGRIEQLPDPAEMKDEVVIQLGHMVGYGAPTEQVIRLTGLATRPRPRHLLAGLEPGPGPRTGWSGFAPRARRAPAPSGRRSQLVCPVAVRCLVIGDVAAVIAL